MGNYFILLWMVINGAQGAGVVGNRTLSKGCYWKYVWWGGGGGESFEALPSIGAYN